MGKDKEQKLEAPGSAFSRMNYLFQASYIMSELSARNSLSNYYNKTMKEISKKIVEKLHPDLKRTICSACNHPLMANSDQINIKLKTHIRKRRKKRMKHKDAKIDKTKVKPVKMNDSINKYSKSRLDARNKRPNKIWLTCCKCNYTKGYLLQPSYKLWIHKNQDNE